MSLFSEDIFQKQCYFGSIDGGVVKILDLFPENRNKTTA
jgi:hypothetical protein